MDTQSTKKTRLHKGHFHAAIFAVIMLFVGFIFCTRLGNTHADRQWSNFLNQDFWNQNPNNGNIIYSLFGDGTIDATAYTRNRTNGCIPSHIQNVGTVPTTLTANTIYVLTGGQYSLTNNITVGGDCVALVGRGDVDITAGDYTFLSNGKNNIIVDNIKIHNSASGQDSSFTISGGTNISLNRIQGYSNWRNGLLIRGNASYVTVSNSQFYGNRWNGLRVRDGAKNVTVNNVLSYGNDVGISFWTENNSINNSQAFNNTSIGVDIQGSGNIINNSIIYNQSGVGLFVSGYITTNTHNYMNNISIYNNGTGIYTDTGVLDLFGTVKMFGNTVFTGGSGVIDITLGTSPVSSPSWSVANTIDTSSVSMDYDQITNPANGSGTKMLNGTNRTTNLRGPQASFNTALRPLRYLFGLYILKQIEPVTYASDVATFYGSNQSDYDTIKYIAELDHTLSTSDFSIVNYYFGSGSMYTQNRNINGCSLGSFQITSIASGTFTTGYLLQDHTIYFLTGGTYQFNQMHDKGFIFDGNCIALVGADTTVINRANAHYLYLLYADAKRNIIVDNIKTNGKFNGNANVGVFFDGASNNTTINKVQAYNFSQYGISLGIGSNFNTIINTQTYNNGEAGLYLYLVSHHNVINNTQSYNNSGYGIWFANGSHRNAMNNFQAYNNAVGVFGDLTTKENIINNAMFYNNTIYGLRLKNSSGNILNNVQIYHNTTGVKAEFGSVNNFYYGEFKLFDNDSVNMEGSNGNDSNLSPGNGIAPFFSGGTLYALSGLMDCSYATNPNLSGTSIYFLDPSNSCLNTGRDRSVFSGSNYNIHYLFGPNIYKQIEPISYDSGDNKHSLPAQYDPSKYIAEIFAIRDTTPEGMSFSFSGANPHSWQESSIYTVHMINTPTSILLTGAVGYISGYLTINGNDIGLSGTVVNGDEVQVRLLSATGFNESVAGVVTIGTPSIGTASTGITLTTRGPITLPCTGTFTSFTNATGANLNIYTGNQVMVTCIETGVLADIAGSGRLAVYSGGSLVSSGTTGLVYSGNEILAVIQSSTQYNTVTTGIVTIGSGRTGFTVQTKRDTYPPTITFTDGASLTGYRSDTIEIDFSGADVISGYAFVSTTGACNSGMNISLLSGYTGAFLVNNHTHNGAYICAYAKDVGNNITTLVSTGTLHVSELRLDNLVETGPVGFDIISLGQTYTTNIKYAFVATGSQCDNTAVMTDYTTAVSVGTTGYNGKYFCAYGEDASGIGEYAISSNPLNINMSMPTLVFTNDTSSGAVLSDTISVYVSTGSSPVGYKFISAIGDCNSSGLVIYSGAITISNESLNGKYFCAYTTFSGYQIPLVSTYPLNIDRTAPSIPTILYPDDDEEGIFFVVFEWTGVVDSGAGISGYTYQISDDDSFGDIIDTDTIITDGYRLSPSDFSETTGGFYRRIKAIDMLGQTSARSDVGSFIMMDNEDFVFSEKEYASLETPYTSDEITMAGIRETGNAWASIDEGTLYKNGTDRGQGAFVKNGDILSIELESSDEYDDTVSSTLTIANRSTDFLITTIEDGDSCTLSSGDEQAIQLIYDNLIGQYSGDQNRYDDFLATMRSMLQDSIDLTNDCNLLYLSDLINNHIVTTVIINTGNHIAPNCKEYAISYNSEKLAFTSPNFKTAVFFANRDALARYIDSKNPGDCHVSSSVTASWYFSNTNTGKHITPNGKIYTIRIESNKYTSPDLQSKKYFTKLIDLRRYLDGKNPPFPIWNHTIDRDFTPVSYIAPNGKAYTIYKTSRGYMSYKLLNIKYYSTLDAIKSLINKNNPK